jgi:hypothetical protein
MKKISILILSILLLAIAEAEQAKRQWIKMVITRLPDEKRNQAVMGPMWVRENGTAHFVFYEKSIRPLVVYVSPRLTADGPALSIWAKEAEEAIYSPANPCLIPVKMDSHTEFELGAGRFRAFVTLEVPKQLRR